MTSFKLLGAALVFSALLATPASAWEPGRGRSRGPDLLHLFGHAWRHLFGHAWRRIGTAYVGTATSRKSHRRRQALSIALIANTMTLRRLSS